MSSEYNDLEANNDKYEIVFMPYKASMWDSLESIWIAANKDKDCACYVVPIPYFDKNSEGKFGKMYYEGDSFPSYVPITYYKEYDLEKRKPDVIYIHNPYDKFNKVTSVLPEYYSNNLKKYTDMLVYVPYFVGLDDVSDIYTMLPGVRFADKVIVQSNMVAKNYKKQYLGNDYDKFLPLGSPKIDKVITSSKISRDKYDIPPEWKKQIGDKKVVLFNTHLNNLINYADKFLEKLEYVFSYFENNFDLILWWRPHPLSAETTNAMNPSYLEVYKELEANYINNNFGIFDNTPDLYRAFVFADAYLGDMSSLVPMFSFLDKPILIQDINLDKKHIFDEANRIPFEDAYIDDKNIWFASSAYNGLFCMDRQTGLVECKAVFDWEKMFRSRLYSKIIRIGNKFLLVPLDADNFAEYNFDTGKIKKIKVKNGKGIGWKFFSWAMCEQYVYIFPCEYPGIVRYNIQTATIEYMDEWFEMMRPFIEEKKSIFMNICVKGNRVYCPYVHGNGIFVFDLKTEELILYEVGDKDEKYTGIECIDQDFWLITRDGEKLVKWNEETNKVDEFELKVNIVKNNNSNSPVFKASCYINGIIYLAPICAKCIVKYNTKLCLTEIIDVKDDFAETDDLFELIHEFGGFVTDSQKDEVYVFPQKIHELVSLNVQTDRVTKENVIVPKDWKNQYGRERGYLDKYDLQYESIFYSIEDYCGDIVNNSIKKSNDKLKKLFINADGTSGLHIHNAVMKNL